MCLFHAWRADRAQTNLSLAIFQAFFAPSAYLACGSIHLASTLQP